jgi:protease I
MNQKQQQLRGRRVAVLAADGFEYVELTVPVKALKLAGASVDVISFRPGKIRGMNLTEPSGTVRVDVPLQHASVDAYDALLLPGGFVGPDFLRQSKVAREFVQAFDEADKPIATLCHGPWLLVSAELVEGRRLAAWPGIRDDVVNAGGIWQDEPVVRDRNWVTSRGPQDLHRFVPAMLELFERGAQKVVREEDELDTPERSSDRADRPPQVAVAAARILPGPAFTALGAAAFGTAAGVILARKLAS